LNRKRKANAVLPMRLMGVTDGSIRTATEVHDQVKTRAELASPLGKSRTPAGLTVTVIERNAGW
jgi:hypothetical protein